MLPGRADLEKHLGMSMLASFFDVRKDSSELFEGLKIAENNKICREWMNQYPVIFLSLKDVDGLSFESAKDMLRMQIAALYNEHFYLKQSERVNENEREIFGQLANVVQGRPTDAMLKMSLSVLMRMMEMHYGKKVILLLDEYDVPLAKASSHPGNDEYGAEGQHIPAVCGDNRMPSCIEREYFYRDQ